MSTVLTIIPLLVLVGGIVLWVVRPTPLIQGRAREIVRGVLIVAVVAIAFFLGLHHAG